MKTDTTLTLKVLQTIEMHTAENPISYATLAEMWSTDWRTIAGIVEQLRIAGYKIGTSRRNDAPGCFMAKTPEELRSTINMMIEDLKKRRANIERLLDWNTNTPSLFQQVPAEIETLDQLINSTPGVS